MRVTAPFATLQDLRFYCNHFDGTFCYTYAGRSFCCNYAGNSFYSSYAVRSFCRTYAGESLYSEMWVTIFIVIMQMGVSVAVMYVSVSSNNFIFFSLTDTHFS